VRHVQSEPWAASIERDHADIASLYPVTRRRYVGRFRLDREIFAPHEPNGIEHNFRVEAKLRASANVAPERQRE